MSVTTAHFAFELANSDNFINQGVSLAVPQLKGTHGLLGQTHSNYVHRSRIPCRTLLTLLTALPASLHFMHQSSYLVLVHPNRQAGALPLGANYVKQPQHYNSLNCDASVH